MSIGFLRGIVMGEYLVELLELVRKKMYFKEWVFLGGLKWIILKM